MISRVYTSRFGNGTGSHGTSTEVVLKKYQVPGTVPSGKPPKSEPYRTVPCSGKAPLVDAFDHFACGILCFNDSEECYRRTIIHF